MNCTARIRPFRTINNTELECSQYTGHGGRHSGILRDYAYQGSKSVISWDDFDRRCFHGEWPGDCAGLGGTCLLPGGHNGECAA